MAEKWDTHLSEIIKSLENNQILVVTGSLYFISEAKPYLCEFLKNNAISL